MNFTAHIWVYFFHFLDIIYNKLILVLVSSLLHPWKWQCRRTATSGLPIVVRPPLWRLSHDCRALPHFSFFPQFTKRFFYSLYYYFRLEKFKPSACLAANESAAVWNPKTHRYDAGKPRPTVPAVFDRFYIKLLMG